MYKIMPIRWSLSWWFLWYAKKYRKFLDSLCFVVSGIQSDFAKAGESCTSGNSTGTYDCAGQCLTNADCVIKDAGYDVSSVLSQPKSCLFFIELRSMERR